MTSKPTGSPKKSQEETEEQEKGISAPKKIYIIAGEESGDQMGASLMSALKRQASYPLQFEGVGGSKMAKEGLKSLFPMTEISIMGLLEIIPHLPNVLTRLRQAIEDITKISPDLVLTIDCPGFNFRVAKKVRSLNIPTVHFTAPSVWAWRPRRAEKVAQFLTHLLTLFPFEPPYFTKHGLKSTFVGHPLLEKKLWEISGEPFRKKRRLKKDQPLLCVLPGSRRQEVEEHLPIFLDTVMLLKTLQPDLEIVIPTLPQFKSYIEEILKKHSFSLPAIVVTEEEKYQAMRASTAALAASGTVTLELGLCEVPTVVAYKANPLSVAILKRLILVKHVSLINILLEKEVVPELLQESCTAEKLSLEVHKILKPKSEAYQTQKKALAKLREIIQPKGGQSPSELAAEVVLKTLDKKS